MIQQKPRYLGSTPHPNGGLTKQIEKWDLTLQVG